METSGQRGAGDNARVQQQGHVDQERRQPAEGRKVPQRNQEAAGPSTQMGGGQITDWASI